MEFNKIIKIRFISIYKILVYISKLRIFIIAQKRTVWFLAKRNMDNNSFLKYFFIFLFIIHTFFRYYLIKTSNDVIYAAFEFVVTEKCNLNCERCSNLMDLYNDPQHYDINKITEDLFNFLDLVYHVVELRIIGGEPFLNRNLSFLIESLFSNKDALNKIEYISFITNGTVIPDKKTISLLKKYKNKIMVAVTNYGEISEKIIKKLEDNNITYTFSSSDDEWLDIGDLKKRNRDTDELKKLFDDCGGREGCNTLLNGKFYVCPLEAHGINISIIPKNLMFLDLRSNESREFKINKLKKLRSLDYIDACDYCDLPLAKVLKTKSELFDA
ncbi:MAG: radical SAM protein [Methanobrevibacter sp.]|jgi:organic radical activating enzyme|nr:radical SAM protein [Candidatus Methanoflexus mossambicus]